MRTKFLSAGFALATALFSNASQAHIRLNAPKARHAQNSVGDPQKTGPCGVGGATDVRGTNINVFAPGQEITVDWVETVNHPGHFRILFDRDGQSFPDPKSYTDYDAGGAAKTLADNIPHAPAGTTKYSVKVKLPAVECESCTLQVLQVMTDKPPFGAGGGSDFYYHCADVALRAATDAAVADGAIEDTSSEDSATPEDTSSAEDGAQVDAGSGAVPGNAATDEAGGCSTMARRPGAVEAVILAALLAARATRKRRAM